MSTPLRLMRIMLAALLLTIGLVPAQRAAACACGAVVSPNPVLFEEGLVVWDGSKQTTTMQFRLSGSPSSAAWIMPADKSANFDLGEKEVFKKLEAATKPEYKYVKKYRFGSKGEGTGGQPKAPGTGVAVQKTQTVGPFEIVTISGNNAVEVDEWLTKNGYGARPDLTGIFQSYLDAGLYINAMKLTPEGAANLSETLPPLRVTETLSEPRYLLKLSQYAKERQHVRIHFASKSKMKIAQEPSSNTKMDLYFAGKVRATTVGLSQGLVDGDQVYLTTFNATYQPSTISSDVTFAEADDQNPYRETHVINEIVYINPAFLLLGVAVVVGIAIALIARGRTKTVSQPSSPSQHSPQQSGPMPPQNQGAQKDQIS